MIHIVIKTRDFFKGTNHEDDWLFYHDALSLLTAKDCIAWMKSHVRTTAKTSENHGDKREKKEWGNKFPMHNDLRSLLDDPEQDVMG